MSLILLIQKPDGRDGLISSSQQATEWAVEWSCRCSGTLSAFLYNVLVESVPE